MKVKKIAYLILAHTDPLQLERLIGALNYQCDFYIHIDAFVDIEPFNRLKLPSNAKLIANRVKVNWAGFSQVKASLNLIKAAVSADEDYSHLVLLSGMDYPIKPAFEIHDYLVSNGDKQFIKFTYMEDSPEWYMPMLTRYYFRDHFPFISNRQIRRGIRYLLENITKSFRRKYPFNLKPCAGSSWWALTLECSKYVVDFCDKNPEFLKFYDYTFASDENFYHTLVANSKYLNQVAFAERNNWKGPHNFANLHIIHPSLQKVYQLDDFEEIASSDKFFVRKVNSSLSTPLLNVIDEKLLAKSSLKI